MKKLLRYFYSVACLVLVLDTYSVDAKDKDPMKIAIIKADDVRGLSEGFSRFIETSKALNIKVSCGIICDSLLNAEGGYKDWLKQEAASGGVEFWNHGWDHKRWEVDGEVQSEFGASGFAHQKQHFNKAQEIMKQTFGHYPISFGTPFNAFDGDTVEVLKEDSNVRLFFCYRDPNVPGTVPAFMALVGEPDGTGKPNAAKFIENYHKKEGITFSALQFHPANFGDAEFDEYVKTIEFLTEEGWVFMLPSEYLLWLEKEKIDS